MRRFILTLVAAATLLSAVAQPAKRVPIGVYVPSDNNIVPELAQSTLTNKLRQIVTANGMGADNHSTFFITCSVNLTDKEVIGGAPTKIVQKADVTFYIADAQNQRVYETITVSTRGVGDNENKAFVSAFKGIQPTSADMKAFVGRANEKIIKYYESQIENFIQRSDALAKLGDYDEALFLLSQIPDVCDGYDKVNAAAINVYQKKLDEESIAALQKAKTAWAAGQNYAAAMEAADYLALVSPYASCYADAEKLIANIRNYVNAQRSYDQKQREEAVAWERKMEEQENVLRSQEIDAWRDVGVAFGENQQPITYDVGWLL